MSMKPRTVEDHSETDGWMAREGKLTKERGVPWPTYLELRGVFRLLRLGTTGGRRFERQDKFTLERLQ